MRWIKETLYRCDAYVKMHGWKLELVLLVVISILAKCSIVFISWAAVMIRHGVFVAGLIFCFGCSTWVDYLIIDMLIQRDKEKRKKKEASNDR